MRFVNLLGNKFFSLAFSWLLGQPIKDTLCGTKVLWRADYERIAANRAYFGDFDPFGDFDLLFGAAKLNLKIVDLPIRYRERTYGDDQHPALAPWLAAAAHGGVRGPADQVQCRPYDPIARLQAMMLAGLKTWLEHPYARTGSRRPRTTEQRRAIIRTSPFSVGSTRLVSGHRPGLTARRRAGARDRLRCRFPRRLHPGHHYVGDSSLPRRRRRSGRRTAAFCRPHAARRSP